MSDEKPVWFAMRATYRRELEAKRILDSKSIECFVPMHYVPGKVNKKKRDLVPVIHNLIFVHATPSRIQQVKQIIPFLQYMVNLRTREKVIVPESQMKRFIAVTGTFNEQLLYFMPNEVNLARGTRIRITGGDFEGHEGIFVKVKGARDRRVVVQIEGVIAVALATIDPDFIEPACQ